MSKVLVNMFILLSVVACSNSQVAEQAKTSNVRNQAPADFNATHGDYQVAIKFGLHTESKPYEEVPWFWGQTESGAIPVEVLRIKYKGKAIYVPRSTFADLSNVNKVSISGTAPSMDIKIRGGDAAESYTCSISVNAGVIEKRVLRSGEFPKSDFEITTYSSNRGED